MEEGINQINQEKQTYYETMVKKFIESLGNIECCKKTSDGIYSEIYNLNGYYYRCDLKNKWITLIIDPTGVYIRAPFHFSKADQVLSKLPEVFGINLNKLRFSEVSFIGVFKLESLPDEVISLTTDDDEIDLSTTKNNRILIDIRGKISLLFDKETHKFIVLEVKDWKTYEKIRNIVDQDVNEMLDKLSLSKPEFIIKTDYVEPVGLESKKKENMLKLLNKLTPIIQQINKIIVDDDEITINNLVLQLKDENWQFDIPSDEFKKLLTLDVPVVLKLHKDFWFIEVHYDYLPKVTSILNIQQIRDLNPKKNSLLFYETKDYYIFSLSDCDNYYHIVSSKNVQKYLQLLDYYIFSLSDCDNYYQLEINDDYKYIIKGHDDEIHIGVYGGNKLLSSLRTFLWYFGVKDFDGLKNLSKEKIISVVRRQINEKYFYPMPFDQVKQHVLTLINNTIIFIDEAINSVKNKTPDFPSMVKDIAEINCIFDRDCQVTLELDEADRLSSYYSLIGTSEGHLPIPSFLEYITTIEGKSDEEDISITKNMIYFIRGYDKEIPEFQREDSFDDIVRGAESELFQKAVVLYNKLLNENKLHCTEDDEEYECPEHTLPDGMGYCRNFDYQPLMQKSEEELANDIIESLLKIKGKMTKIREKMLKTDSPTIVEGS